ncbi:glycosyl hydrolase family 28 protein [Paenibacillus xanthanilyticus]|uniref:Glycosyl hydrolase family 28 protein n=1 Tax=Paenibacillus xanthanilyticus TaxID=1783531 RepID=A0ABV8K8Q5_9BACL
MLECHARRKWSISLLIVVVAFGFSAFFPVTERAAEAAPATMIIPNPIPDGVHRVTSKYTVTANGVNLPVIDGQYQTTVTENGVTRTVKPGYLGYDYTTFTASQGEVELVITSPSAINSIAISPLKLGITPSKVNANTYKFTTTGQQYLIVNVNGSKLVIARDDMQEYVPTLGAPGVFHVASYIGNADAADQSQVAAITAAFQQAANDASAYGTSIGGGTKGIVYVPAGLYYLGNLKLRSNTALYLAPGSVIRFADDYSLYHVDFYKASLNRNGTWWIYTEHNSTNIKIFGRGTIDGNGHYFQKDKPAGDPGFATTAIMALGTSNFTLEGLVIKDIPFWGTIIARSNDVYVSNMKFFNSLDGNENDCIDVNESQNVSVWDSIGISLDDNFSTKTWEGKGMMENWYGASEPLSNVTFNNVFGWTYCATFKLGHGAHQTQSGVTFKNSVTYYAGRAIGIEHRYGTALFTGITFDNIDIEDAGEEGWFKAVIEDGGLGVGPITNVTVRNINIHHRGSASSLKGYSDAAKISGMTFENIRVAGNPEYVTSLGELNITNKGFYENVTFLPDRSGASIYRIQAENNNGLFGVDWNGGKSIKHVASNDTDAVGYQIGQIAHNNYAVYKGVDFGANTSKVRIRYDAPRAVRIELYKGNASGAGMGSMIGSINLPGNGNQWLQWNAYDIPVTGASGIQDLYIVFKVSGSTATNQLLGSLNWFELTRS